MIIVWIIALLLAIPSYGISILVACGINYIAAENFRKDIICYYRCLGNSFRLSDDKLVELHYKYANLINQEIEREIPYITNKERSKIANLLPICISFHETKSDYEASNLATNLIRNFIKEYKNR